MNVVISVVMGFILDCIFGDPDFKLHPIRLMGNLISASEKVLRRLFPKNKAGELAGGFMLFMIVSVITTGIVYVFLKFVYGINIYAGLICESILCWLFLAARSLKTESMKVYYEAEKGDLISARKAVSMIVGRDTERLDMQGVIKAAVETVAENTSDGVIAPMIFMAIGGAPLGAFYKAVNTMDSMVGYRNEKYLYFGRIAARADDIFNFIPSRISAIMMIAASFILKMDYKGAVKIFKRDRLKHKSPNSAQTEAVCAGALGLRLAGDAWYFGELYKKDYIGDHINEVVPEHIIKADRLMYAASVLTLIAAVVLRIVIMGGI